VTWRWPKSLTFFQLKLPELASVCSERRPEAPGDWHDCDTTVTPKPVNRNTHLQKPSENHRHKVEVEFCWINYSSKYIKIISKHRVNSSSENCGSVRFLSCGLQWHAVTYGHQSLSPISVPFGLPERNQIFLQFPQLRRTFRPPMICSRRIAKHQIDFGSDDSRTILKILWQTSVQKVPCRSIESLESTLAIAEHRFKWQRVNQKLIGFSLSTRGNLRINTWAPKFTEISKDWKQGQGLLNLGSMNGSF
jgi:hypothetical protein